MMIQIRCATVEDIPTLNQLIAESVRTLSRGYYSNQQIESALINIFGVDTQLIADETYFVAVSDNQIVGCGGWSKRKTLFGGDQAKSIEDTLLDPATEPARIRAFFVHPSWVRNGIGSNIMRVCERAATEAGFKQIELASTLPGEPLYRVFGYEAQEVIEVPLSENETLPVIRMKKNMT